MPDFPEMATRPPERHAGGDLSALASLEPDCRAMLLEGATIGTLARGAAVFRPGDPCRAWLIVLEGSVRVQLVDGEGHEIVLYRVAKGESCVLTTCCLLAGGPYDAEAVAETETRAILVPKERFERLLDHSPSFRRLVFRSFSVRLADLMGRVREVAFGRIDARLAGVLLARSAGRPDPITLRHQDLAVELGTAREVVSRRLKEFERRGWVRLGRGMIELADPPALARLAGRCRR